MSEKIARKIRMVQMLLEELEEQYGVFSVNKEQANMYSEQFFKTFKNYDAEENEDLVILKAKGADANIICILEAEKYQKARITRLRCKKIALRGPIRQGLKKIKLT